MTRVLLLFMFGCGPLLGFCSPTTAADRTSIAITAAAAESDRMLAETLILLVEAQLLADDLLAVVERRQIELAMQELALSRSRSADESLQLGKLVTADILVMMELRKSNNKSEKPSAMLRVVEAKTAAIRGITVASDVEETLLEDIAEQFARYVSMVIREPQTPTITVAVAPFESVGRFDRLRPLELGIRDLVMARLLALSSPVAPRQESRTTGRSHGDVGTSNVEHNSAVLSRSDRATFQVVQRSNLEQLLRELDLIQSGFADKDRLPRTLSDRQAAFLIKGEIDERQVDGKFTIVVRGELRHAASAKVRDSFEFECPPAGLESQLAARVDSFAKHFGVAIVPGLSPFAPRKAELSWSESPHSEADSLKSLALRDLHRFRRQCPIDFSHRAFAMPGEAWLRSVPRMARPETPLGLALLRKSIDRLETVLFIHPDDAEAAYALGFCFSIHQPEIYRPERADELLRRAAASKPDEHLAALALVILSELAFDDQDGRFDPLPSSHTRQSVGSHVLANMATARDAAAERLWFAFEKMPAQFRDNRWPGILGLFAPLQRTPEQNAARLEKLIPITEQAEAKHRQQLAGLVKSLAVQVSSQSKDKPGLKAKAISSLRRWTDGPDAELADFGRQGLATICERDSDFLEAAKLYEASAAVLADATSVQDRIKHDVQLVKAATNYRLGKQPDRALRLLQSFEPIAGTNSIVDGLHGYEMGLSHEALEEPQKALAAYLRTTEACPLIVPNTDIVQKIIKLGGVPLREDRDVDVKYVTGENNQWLRTTALATDGRRLFLGGVVPVQFHSTTKGNATGTRRFYGGVGVAAFDPDSRTWQSLNTDLEVTCLKIRDRALWVGTYDRGLWRYELDAKKWTNFGTDQGLPDPHVESIAFRQNEVIVGVGSAAAGGLIRLDQQGKVHLFNGPNAPTVAPTHLVVTDKELLVRTLQTIHKWSWESQSWSLHPDEPNRLVAVSSRLFAGENGVWASNYGRELIHWNADDQINQIFKPAWYFTPTVKAGYLVNFVAQHGDEVWFGGTPWSDFISSGLYRIHLKTGAFHKFTPADGFSTVHEHSISDGLWLDNRLWLATSSGLCVVTPRH